MTPANWATRYSRHGGVSLLNSGGSLEADSSPMFGPTGKLGDGPTCFCPSLRATSLPYVQAWWWQSSLVPLLIAALLQHSSQALTASRIPHSGRNSFPTCPGLLSAVIHPAREVAFSSWKVWWPTTTSCTFGTVTKWISVIPIWGVTAIEFSIWSEFHLNNRPTNIARMSGRLACPFRQDPSRQDNAFEFGFTDFLVHWERVQELNLFDLSKSHLLWVQQCSRQLVDEFVMWVSYHACKSCPVIPGSNALLQVLQHCRDQLHPVFTSTNLSSACHRSILCSNFDQVTRVLSRSSYHPAPDFCESHDSFSNNFRGQLRHELSTELLSDCAAQPLHCSGVLSSFSIMCQDQAQPGCNHPAGCLTRERALAEDVGLDRKNPLHCLVWFIFQFYTLVHSWRCSGSIVPPSWLFPCAFFPSGHPSRVPLQVAQFWHVWPGSLGLSVAFLDTWWLFLDHNPQK